MKTREAIDDFLRSCKARGLSVHTINWYREQLDKFDNDYPDLPTEPEPIESFLSGIDRTPETKHAYFRTLRAFFNFTAKRKDIPNPIKKVSPPRCPLKVMPTLEADEIMRLLDLPKSPRDQALLILLIDTGIRAKEAASLRLCDIGQDSITVRGKTGERIVPISQEARNHILTVLKDQSANSYIFPGRRGPITTDRLYHLVRSYMQQANIASPKLGPHRLRHSFGRAWIMGGGDLRSLQKIMGHASITTTEKYIALSPEDLIHKHQRFSPLKQARASVVLEEAKTIVKETKCRKP